MLMHLFSLWYVYSDITWQAQNPVSYQGWTNYNDGKNNITSFEERTDLNTIWEINSKDYISLKNTTAIKKVKISSSNTIYPLVNHCTLLLVSNLAYPQWVSVDCCKPVLHHIICLINEKIKPVNNKKENHLRCSNITVKHNSTCYLFRWFNDVTSSRQSFYDKCKIRKIMPLTITDLHKFSFILDGTSAVKLNFLSELSINSVNVFSYEKIWLQVKYANQIVDKKFASGFYICHGKTEHLKFDLHNLYECFNNTFISALHVCDGSSDCSESKMMRWNAAAQALINIAEKFVMDQVVPVLHYTTSHTMANVSDTRFRNLKNFISQKIFGNPTKCQHL